MELKQVAVLGGGPGGLFAARLLKLHQPGCRVVVYERSEPERTFGFGVGLQTATQHNLRRADPELLDAILARALPHEMSMSIGDETVAMPIRDLIAIGRGTLLEVLRDQAVRAGVELRYGQQVSAGDVLADLVIAADGVNSATRESRADQFGATIDWHNSLYLWCGADFALHRALFRPETTEHGAFVAHAYPYAPDRSTFLIETDAETWSRAGFDRSGEQVVSGGNDEVALDYLSQTFAGTLRGRRLIGNQTRWLRFRTVRCERWHAGNVVLLGDAAATAHYSIGSGTKLAMETAIALVAALDDADDLATALSSFDAARRPAVEHLQAVATRSMLWWDDFPNRLHLPLEQLLLGYMTRAGKVSLDGFADTAPAVLRRGLAQYAGVAESEVPSANLTDWVLSRPLFSGARSWPTRTVQAGALAGAGLAVVDATRSWEEALSAFEASEKKRWEGDLVGARISSDHRALAAAALASGRVDLIEIDE
ncbi:FAD-dependent monooxygenase [Nocardioides panzhihuensis]|uniref:Anthraniloyl-CoA monooxygenase n=1 Tax=Nocardioides panzhihuensis TaxID=860243 RepID=A0A7Z0DS46_9ACTN|nr:FAD-dependent monooxygenase [Nocardioides panzhihuensis]NYI80394.1 anthraniloyl-CoA monooxygenase [Nocardioides panzhihuensis]